VGESGEQGRDTPGPVALVGSGEYLPVMEETDLALLERVGGPAQARVVVVPTASGLEHADSPRRWMSMGLQHFKRLGAQVEAVAILNHDDADDPRWLPPLEAADFIYFSGGSPRHLVQSLAGTRAWEVVRGRYEAGAVLAGCSAGAMALGGLTSSPRAMSADQPVAWLPALGVLPRLIMFPHFDRVVHFIGAELLERAVRSAPPGMTLLGVDEETALVRLSPANGAAGEAGWQVMGRRGVTVFGADGHRTTYGPGATLSLRLS